MNAFSKKPSTPLPKAIIGLLLLVSFIGFVDAAYLTVQHYLGAPPACSIFEGCEKVTTSRYATLLGLPVALLGTVYYLVIFLALVAYLDRRREIFVLCAAAITPVGLAASAWFVFLQIFVIEAICPYCMVSALASTVLFVLGVWVWRSFRGASAGRSSDLGPAGGVG